jgi:hypothetical protein
VGAFPCLLKERNGPWTVELRLELDIAILLASLAKRPQQVPWVPWSWVR